MRFRPTLFQLLILTGALSSNLSAQEGRAFCPGWTFIGSIQPDLTEVEKRLICGHKDADQTSQEGWAQIPFAQAKYNLSNFAQERGYYQLKFIQDPSDPQKVTVDIGLPTRVKKVLLRILGPPDGSSPLNVDWVPIDRKRDVVGQPLTPSLLDRLEQWVSHRIEDLGYACPKLVSRANSETGVIELIVETGFRQNVVSVEQESIPEVEDHILRRYDAFKIGNLFSESQVSVTAARVKNKGIIESTYFTKTCGVDGVHLKQAVVSGPPRLLSMGVGANTEGVLLGKASWKHTRLGKFASLIDVSVLGSSRVQTLTGTVNEYFLPSASRTFLNPVFELTHRNEAPYEAFFALLQLGIATDYDWNNLGVSFFVGPSYNRVRTLRGSGSPDMHLLSLEVKTVLKSHEFEFNVSNPMAGFLLNLTTDFNSQSIVSDVSAQRIYLRGESLWNLNQYDPPLWILGLRGGLGLILTGEQPAVVTPLPSTYLQYLGGSADLRGFGRQSLGADTTPDGSPLGGLTAVFVGGEARLSHTVPFNLDPFVFVDAGFLGKQSLSLSSPLYWSPGLGLRWASPFGSMRITLARGYSDMSGVGWQTYFSFGEEF